MTPTAIQNPRQHANVRPAMRNGTPRPGGRLQRFIAACDTDNHPIIEGGIAYVSVEGQGPRRAVLDLPDFLRLTARDQNGPELTRTRWWLDDDDLLRAYSLREKPFTHGVLVAAAILGSTEGDMLDLPADPLDLRLSSLRRVAA